MEVRCSRTLTTFMRRQSLRSEVSAVAALLKTTVFVSMKISESETVTPGWGRVRFTPANSVPSKLVMRISLMALRPVPVMRT